MRLRHFLRQVEHERIHRAIQAAEENSSGRIVVYIGRRRIGDALEAAQRAFQKLRLENESQTTGLLLFVAPKSRKFAVVGGTALHARLGQEWWDHLAQVLAGHFREDRYTEGLLAAIAEAGRAFHLHFPSDGTVSPTRDDIVEE